MFGIPLVLSIDFYGFVVMYSNSSPLPVHLDNNRTLTYCVICFEGNTHIGLLHTCITIYGRNTTCFTPSHIRGEWVSIKRHGNC